MGEEVEEVWMAVTKGAVAAVEGSVAPGAMAAWVAKMAVKEG